MFIVEHKPDFEHLAYQAAQKWLPFAMEGKTTKWPLTESLKRINWSQESIAFICRWFSAWDDNKVGCVSCRFYGSPWCKGLFCLATREPLCPHKCFMMFYELLCDVSLRKAMAQRFDLYVLSCPALFCFFPPADGTTLGVKIDVYEDRTWDFGCLACNPHLLFASARGDKHV